MFSFNFKKNKQQVEGQQTIGSTSVTVVAGLDGYDWKYYKRTSQYSSTRGKNVHVSMNGPLQMTFNEARQFAWDLIDFTKEAEAELRSNA